VRGLPGERDQGRGGREPTETPTPLAPATGTLPFALSRAPAPNTAARREAAAPSATPALSRRPALPRLRAISPLQLAAVASLPLLLVSLPLVRGEAALEREVASLIERGDLAGARRRLEAAARERPDDPLVEKLRGDVACARGAPGECLRRYRVALASRPELREDGTLRANARRLVQRNEACSTRRAAAHLLGELRDADAVPVLEEARRSAGIFAAFCTGDAFDRAIAATRASLVRGRDPLARSTDPRM